MDRRNWWSRARGGHRVLSGSRTLGMAAFFRHRPTPEVPAAGQRSVWDFPRPPAVEREPRTLRVVLAGETVAQTSRGVKVLETSHPPVFYFPPDDVDASRLVAAGGAGTACEWKGRATYFDVGAGSPDRPIVLPGVAFSYPKPTKRFAEHAGWISFYAGPFVERGRPTEDGGAGDGSGCFVDDELVEPQPGGFYSGWITRDVVGPFKGIEGSWGW